MKTLLKRMQRRLSLCAGFAKALSPLRSASALQITRRPSMARVPGSPHLGLLIIFALAAFVTTSLGQAPETKPKPAADGALKSSWNVREHIPLEKFIIQSHRGAGELAPENTIEAFELGWKLGTYPEADIRMTKDGVIVAFHDETFARVVKGIDENMKKKGVADVTFEELSRLDVGAWMGDQFKGRRVSRMSEVFALMKDRPERHLYLDIKNVDLRKLAAEVKAAGVNHQVVLASPKHEIIRHWKALVPESDTLLWIGGTESAKRKALETLKAANFEGITQVQIHVRMPSETKETILPGESFTPSRAFLMAASRELSSRGILFQTLPYGAKDEATYHQLLDLGLASFATDHPEVTVKAVRNYYEKQK